MQNNFQRQPIPALFCLLKEIQRKNTVIARSRDTELHRGRPSGQRAVLSLIKKNTQHNSNNYYEYSYSGMYRGN